MCLCSTGPHCTRRLRDRFTEADLEGSVHERGTLRVAPCILYLLGLRFWPGANTGLQKNKKRTMFPIRSFGETIMVRAVAEEALALASISLFLGMVAVWAQVLGVI